MTKQKTKIIGLTGGIATGKSTVTKFLRQRKLPVICADEISHHMTQKGQPAYRKILKEFGEDYLLPNQEFDRKKLASLVFHNQKAKKTLENIVHPLVRKEIKKQIAKSRKSNEPIVFLDIPLLFESGWEKICDATICIYTTQKIQIERLKKTRGMSRQEILVRIHNQMPLQEKCEKSDFIVRNVGSRTELKKEIKKILKSIQQTA